jgi:TonB family protein
VAVAGVLLAGAALGLRWISRNRETPGPRKVMQFTVVNVLPQQPRPLPPPPQVAPPKPIEQPPQTTRVELKASDVPPPDAPPSAAPPTPAAGPLALAAAGEGPGDAFNLAGNPGGRALLGPGGLGDGSGEGVLGGTGRSDARFAWYASRAEVQIADAFRRNRKLRAASTRVELRIWIESSGRISRVQPVKSTGDPEVDQELESAVGTSLPPPPPDLPMPMVLLFTARRPT